MLDSHSGFGFDFSEVTSVVAVFCVVIHMLYVEKYLLKSVAF